MVDPDKKAEALEQKIRQRLLDAGGFASSGLRLLDSFFSSYKETPRPELFGKVCTTIIDMNLMYLPEHRFGIAGGVAAVVSLHPDLAPEWRKAYPALLASAERLALPLEDASILTIGQVEYLWLWWLVTRDEHCMTRLIRLSHRHGDVGNMAQALLLTHSNIPRVREVLETEGKSWNQSPIEAMDVEVQHLAQALAGIPGVLCVGRQEDGMLVAVTADGSRPAACPEGVMTRKPTPAEAAAIRQHLDDMEDP
jgi:hypothetical protein